MQAANPATAAIDGSAPLVFDPTLEYPKEQMVLYWQPSSYFLQWPPSLLTAEEVSHYYVEQYMMAETVRFFQGHRAAELIRPLPDPREH